MLIIAAVSGYAINDTSTLRCAARRRLRTRADGGHTPRGAQCHVREARGEHRHDHERRRVAAPRPRHEQVPRITLVRSLKYHHFSLALVF